MTSCTPKTVPVCSIQHVVVIKPSLRMACITVPDLRFGIKFWFSIFILRQLHLKNVVFYFLMSKNNNVNFFISDVKKCPRVVPFQTILKVAHCISEKYATRYSIKVYKYSFYLEWLGSN